MLAAAGQPGSVLVLEVVIAHLNLAHPTANLTGGTIGSAEPTMDVNVR